MKKCPQCGEEDLANFSPNRNYKDSLNSWCKSCINKHQRDHRKEDRDYAKARYDIVKKRYTKNRAKYLYQVCKARAKKNGLDFSIIPEDIIIPEFCPILGVRIVMEELSHKEQYGPSVDRIDNARGYVKGNIMVISKKANAMKNSASIEELNKFCEYFTNLMK